MVGRLFVSKTPTLLPHSLAKLAADEKALIVLLTTSPQSKPNTTNPSLLSLVLSRPLYLLKQRGAYRNTPKLPVQHAKTSHYAYMWGIPFWGGAGKAVPNDDVFSGNLRQLVSG